MSAWFGGLVALFVGLIGWRVQLIGKRRTELAEEALLAFAHAVDALRAIRSPISWPGEAVALRKELGRDPDKQGPGEHYAITLRRLRLNQDQFAAMRRPHLLCRYHFEEAAGKAFDDILAAVREVAAAADTGFNTPPRDNDTEDMRQKHKQWRATISAGRTRPDTIADKVDAAQRALESVLTPHLRADAALLPVALGWRACLAWAKSRLRVRRTPKG